MGIFRNASYEKRVVKAVIADANVIVGMTADKRLTIYYTGRKIQLVRSLEFADLKNFDIFENFYLILYQGKNIITIFTMEKELQLVYKMRLPLYKDYENLEFIFRADYN